MPENQKRSVFEKCNSCATSEGPGLGPLPTVSHQDVCCLFKLGQSPPFLNEGSHKRYDFDGLRKDCPSREALQVGPICPPPPRSDGPNEDIVALPTGSEAAPAVRGPSSRKRKKIKPRLRLSFKKLTIEIRPPRFKKKLWFGTFTEEEIDRAEDAVNYYIGYDQPYNYPDSQRIFAGKPLELKFEDLMPSCDQIIEVDGEEELAHKYFARQVKEVIHSVTGKQKKTQKKNKCKVSEKIESLLQEAPPRLNVYDPIVCSAPGSTTSSGTQCVTCPGPEADSQLAASHPMFLPPARMFTQEDEEIAALLRYTTQMPSYELLSNRWGEGMFPLPLDEMFTFPSAIPTPGYGESSTMEEDGYLTENLWAFPNEGPGFPPE